MFEQSATPSQIFDEGRQSLEALQRNEPLGQDSSVHTVRQNQHQHHLVYSENTSLCCYSVVFTLIVLLCFVYLFISNVWMVTDGILLKKKTLFHHTMGAICNNIAIYDKKRKK